MLRNLHSRLHRRLKSKGHQYLAQDRFPASAFHARASGIDRHPIHSFRLNKYGHGVQGPAIRKRLADVYLTLPAFVQALSTGVSTFKILDRLYLVNNEQDANHSKITGHKIDISYLVHYQQLTNTK